MRNLYKTILWTAFVCFIAIIGAIFLQINAESKLDGTKCSYLDPIIVDYFAFGVAIFLIMEGIYRIAEHKDTKYTKQFTRSVRIAIGFIIVTLHIMQFFHK